MSEGMKIVLAAVAAALVGFGVGALWQNSSARGYAGRLETIERDLTFQRLEATLGAATVEAQRGSYELARQLSSEFFTGLQSSVTVAPADRRAAFQELLGLRDIVITTLSRSDPQSGSMLAQMFVRYRVAMGEPVGPEGGSAPAPATGNSTPPQTPKPPGT